MNDVDADERRLSWAVEGRWPRRVWLPGGSLTLGEPGSINITQPRRPSNGRIQRVSSAADPGIRRPGPHGPGLRMPQTLSPAQLKTSATRTIHRADAPTRSRPIDPSPHSAPEVTAMPVQPAYRHVLMPIAATACWGVGTAASRSSRPNSRGVAQGRCSRSLAWSCSADERTQPSRQHHNHDRHHHQHSSYQLSARDTEPLSAQQQ